jgi:hypothetical protein
MPDRWCTVTVTDASGRRHSLDLLASSTYDAAHLYVTHVKGGPPGRLSFPIPTVATVFEVAANGAVYGVTGNVLQQWIERRRHAWNGPKGAIFRKRPGME